MNDAGQALTEVAVRSVRAADAEAIARIYAHYVRHGTASFDTEPRTCAQTEQKIRDILSKGWPFIVAERAETIMGYAYVTAFRDRPAYGYTCEDSIYVDVTPNYHPVLIRASALLLPIWAGEARGCVA